MLRPLLLSKECLRDLGCHIDLGRGHLFFEKLGVRTVAESRHAPHLLFPLTSFGLQGHKIPAEIQSRIGFDECPVYRTIVTAPDRTEYIRGSPEHLTIMHLKPKAPSLDPCMERMDRRITSVMKRETIGKTEMEDG